MALLSIPERKKRFKALGLGEYNTANIKKLQKKYFTRKKDIDGVYGTDTDRLLRHVYNCSLVKNFKPEEFRCECGGKYCTGYPSYMKMVELNNLQKIRTHFGKPVKVTSGMRCKTYNSKCAGSIRNSKHLTGYAADIYIPGVTDTLAGRKKVINYAKTLPNHNYSYCNGYNSSGANIRAAYMGSAVHTDTNAPKKAAPKTSTGAEKILAKAKEFAWPYGTAKSKFEYPNGSAKTVYKVALKNMMGKSAKISQTDCGYFVSTCVRASGVAPKFLALPAKASQAYPSVPSTMKIVSKGSVGTLQPGDVIRYRKTNGHQHTVIFLGDGMIAHAGRGHWFPKVVKAKPWNNSNVKKSTIQVIRAK